MEKHTCKLCFRQFLNGHALGGHMRSHVMSSNSDVTTGRASTSSPEKPESATPLSYVLRENPKRSIRISDPDQYISIKQGGDDESSSIVQDVQESYNNSPRAAAPRRRRSKQSRRSSPPPLVELEDVARSLMLLSRDVWVRSDPKSELKPKPKSKGELFKKAKQSRFQCDSCKKVFKSFQALGGHRASFKKGKGGCVGENNNVNLSSSSSPPAVHQCPFCPKVLCSGQALGGHKRSHLYASSANKASQNVSTDQVINGDNVGINSFPSSSSSPIGFIDLNLPASAEDEFELSAVYDGDNVLI